jgi:hypothetical protein
MCLAIDTRMNNTNNPTRIFRDALGATHSLWITAANNVRWCITVHGDSYKYIIDGGGNPCEVLTAKLVELRSTNSRL